MRISRFLLMLSLLAGVSGCGTIRQTVSEVQQQYSVAVLNATENGGIKYVREPKHVWALPENGEANCTGFALAKIRQLELRGATAWLMVSVDPKTGPHALAVARFGGPPLRVQNGRMVLDGFILDLIGNRTRPFERRYLPNADWDLFSYDLQKNEKTLIAFGRGRSVWFSKPDGTLEKKGYLVEN